MKQTNSLTTLPKFRIVGRGAIKEKKPERVNKSKRLNDWLQYRNRTLLRGEAGGGNRINALMRLYDKPSKTLWNEVIPTVSRDSEEMLANPDQPRQYVVRSNCDPKDSRWGWKSVYQM